MKRTGISLLLLTLTGLPAASFAATVTVNYTGTVTLANYGHVDYGYAVNDTITGFFEFDSDDVQDDSFPGVYLQSGIFGPITSNTGDGGFATSGDSGGVYAEDLGFGPDLIYGEVYLVDASRETTRVTLGGDPTRYRRTTDFFSHGISRFEYDSYDLGGSFLDALLLSPQSMTGLISSGSSSETFQCAPNGGFACIPDQRVIERNLSSRVEFNLTGLQVADLQTSEVPVPAAIWLFGTALVGLVGFGKRRKAA